MERDYNKSDECKSCWWQEGGLCYLEPCTRSPNGRSIKIADKRCSEFLGKRQALSQVIPNEKLVILSELDERK